jgi:hypothetical protein
VAKKCKKDTKRYKKRTLFLQKRIRFHQFFKRWMGAVIAAAAKRA